jgi:acyl carrier protein
MPAETHRSSPAPSDAELLDTVKDVLGEVCAIDADAIECGTALASLDVDDLSLLDVVDALEHELGERTIGVSIADDDLAEIQTVQDLLDVLHAALAKAHP